MGSKKRANAPNRPFLDALLCLSLSLSLSLRLFFQRRALRRAERGTLTRSAGRKRSAAAAAASCCALLCAAKRKKRVSPLDRTEKVRPAQKRRQTSRRRRRKKRRGNGSLDGRQLGLAPPSGVESVRGCGPCWLPVAGPRSWDPKVPRAGPCEVRSSGPTDFDRGERLSRLTPGPPFLARRAHELFPKSVNTIHRAVPCVWMLVTSGFLETRLIKVSVEMTGPAIEWSSRSRLPSVDPRGNDPGRDQVLGKTRKFEPRFSTSGARRLFLTML